MIVAIFFCERRYTLSSTLGCLPATYVRRVSIVIVNDRLKWSHQWFQKRIAEKKQE